MLPNLDNFIYCRHHCVFRYAHDMFRLRTCIEKVLMTYDVKLPAWLLHNSQLSCDLSRLSCFPNRRVPNKNLARKPNNAVYWYCPYSCFAQYIMSQLLFVLLTCRISMFSPHKQIIAWSVDDCVAFILCRTGTILFHFTRLLSVCYLRCVSLSAYPAIPDTNERK
jgi:hypothetical protein